VLCVGAALAAGSSAGIAGTERVHVAFYAPRAVPPTSAAFQAPNRHVVPLQLANGTIYHCSAPPSITAPEVQAAARAHLAARDAGEGGATAELHPSVAAAADAMLWERDMAALGGRRLHRRVAGELLDGALKGTCFTQVVGWWTYELCWPFHLRQFHPPDAKGENGAEYFLGRGPAAELDDGATRALYFETVRSGADTTRAGDQEPMRGRAQSIFSRQAAATAAARGTPSVVANSARLRARWPNGTKCDLTGNDRVVHLALTCAVIDDAAAAFDAKTLHVSAKFTVEEPVTCEYEVELKHRAFCAVPHMHPHAAPVTEVSCVQVRPEDYAEVLRSLV
jgi:hypothetical protein